MGTFCRTLEQAHLTLTQTNPHSTLLGQGGGDLNDSQPERRCLVLHFHHLHPARGLDKSECQKQSLSLAGEHREHHSRQKRPAANYCL